MMKKLSSIILSIIVVFSFSVPAFATSGFDQSVFNKRDDLYINQDDMTGTTLAIPLSYYTKETSIIIGSNAIVTLAPMILLTDSVDDFFVSFEYISTSPIEFENIIVKVGDNRYTFSNCYITYPSIDDTIYRENISFCMKKQTIRFMKDLIEHRDEEIKVRLNGTLQKIDFSLTDGMKDSLIGLYDLYVAGGGTRESNMFRITENDQVIVELNGKELVGNFLPIFLEAVSNLR